MGNKFDITNVKLKLDTINFKILSKKYIHANSLLTYQCECGEKHKSCYSNLSVGKRHKNCNYKKTLNKKIQLHKVKIKLKSCGYTLCSIVYINKDSKLNCICPNGHKIKITYGHFLRGVRCGICFRLKNKGKSHPSYKPELTVKDRISRRLDPMYIKWQQKVKNKDNYTCQICKDRSGGNLVSHHIYSYDKFPKFRYSIWNGITLCNTCHTEFHKTFGYGKNDMEQFSLFIEFKNYSFLHGE